MDFMAQLTIAEIILGFVAIGAGPVLFLLWFLYTTWPILTDRSNCRKETESQASKVAWKFPPPV